MFVVLTFLEENIFQSATVSGQGTITDGIITKETTNGPILSRDANPSTLVPTNSVLTQSLLNNSLVEQIGDIASQLADILNRNEAPLSEINNTEVSSNDVWTVNEINGLINILSDLENYTSYLNSNPQDKSNIRNAVLVDIVTEMLGSLGHNETVSNIIQWLMDRNVTKMMSALKDSGFTEACRQDTLLFLDAVSKGEDWALQSKYYTKLHKLSAVVILQVKQRVETHYRVKQKGHRLTV